MLSNCNFILIAGQAELWPAQDIEQVEMCFTRIFNIMQFLMLGQDDKQWKF